MPHDRDTTRDWLDLLPRDAWPEPWRSMGAGVAPRPGIISDQETPEPIAAVGTMGIDPRLYRRLRRLRAAQLRRSFRINQATGTPRELLIAFALWDTAVARAADGDTEQLVALLRSDTPLHRDARDLLAELHATRQIKNKPGRQTTPGRVSPAQGELQWQAALYRDHRRRGLGHDEALRQALVDYRAEQITLRGEKPPSDEAIAEAVTDAEVERLHAHIRGKDGASRRVWKRKRG